MTKSGGGLKRERERGREKAIGNPFVAQKDRGGTGQVNKRNRYQIFRSQLLPSVGKTTINMNLCSQSVVKLRVMNNALRDIVKIRAFRGVAPCSLGVDQRFRGMYSHYQQGEEGSSTHF
jgi:hypothetical protein